MNKIGNRIKRIERACEEGGIEESLHIMVESCVRGRPDLTIYSEVLMGKGIHKTIVKPHKLVNGKKVFIKKGYHDSLTD